MNSPVTIDTLQQDIRSALATLDTLKSQPQSPSTYFALKDVDIQLHYAISILLELEKQ